MIATYLVGNEELKSYDPALSEILAQARSKDLRPLCLCKQPGVPMYVAKIGDRHYVKRMPNSGGAHAPACDSYEPPPEISGLGEVLGSAIHENSENGQVSLSLDFSLRKMPGRAPPMLSAADADSVTTDGTKLTLRATLHYLWDEAGFTRWAPAMARKRNWHIIRRYLLHAAENKTAKGSSLVDLLYVPESFDLDRKDEIERRRIAHLCSAAPGSGVRRLMLVIAEVKSIERSRYGYKAVFKHLPDFHFMMNEDLHKRLMKRFGVELELWEGFADTHLLAIGTFSIGATGLATIEELSLMLVNAHWIPFDSTFDRSLIQTMIDQDRYFTKSLRYNLAATRPLACLVATDTAPAPTAMFVIPPDASEEYIAAQGSLLESAQMPTWVWHPGRAPIPSLPQSANFGAAEAAHA